MELNGLELILAALLGISEALSLIPGLKGNGIFDTVVKFLKKLSGKSE